MGRRFGLAGYPAEYRISGIRHKPNIRYSAKKVSGQPYFLTSLLMTQFNLNLLRRFGCRHKPISNPTPQKGVHVLYTTSISGIFLVGLSRISGWFLMPDIRYPDKKVSGPTLIFSSASCSITRVGPSVRSPVRLTPLSKIIFSERQLKIII